jgi:hypothetical protein
MHVAAGRVNARRATQWESPPFSALVTEVHRRRFDVSVRGFALVRSGS